MGATTPIFEDRLQNYAAPLPYSLRSNVPLKIGPFADAEPSAVDYNCVTRVNRPDVNGAAESGWREMDIPIDARVRCTDGLGGRSTRVSVNPVSNKVTYLVVRERRLQRTERLVPIKRVKGTGNDLIHLDCTRRELSKMAPLIETGLVWADIPEIDEQHPYLLSPCVAWMPSVARDDPLLHGELCIRRGARVQATDGKAGWIDELVVVPANGEITHLLLRRGRLWDRMEVAIPVSEVIRLDERAVYLKLDKKGVEALPSVPVWKK